MYYLPQVAVILGELLGRYLNDWVMNQEIMAFSKLKLKHDYGELLQVYLNPSHLPTSNFNFVATSRTCYNWCPICRSWRIIKKSPPCSSSHHWMGYRKIGILVTTVAVCKSTFPLLFLNTTG
jgi:hypothetical protein